MSATGYEPLNTLKPVADSIWLIDGPAILYRKVPYPTRATVIRLQNGTLWVHSPTELTPELKTELEAIGPLGYLIVPNRDHLTHLTDWQKSFPDAKTWAPVGVVEWAAQQGLTLHIDAQVGPDMGDEHPWPGEIEIYVACGIKMFREAVFFHKDSRTLILTDFIQALETAKLSVWLRPRVWLAGIDDSDPTMPPRLRRLFLSRDHLAQDVEQMMAWKPQRIIISHGRWFESNGVGILVRSFRRVLQKHRWEKITKQSERSLHY